MNHPFKRRMRQQMVFVKEPWPFDDQILTKSNHRVMLMIRKIKKHII